MIGCHARVLPEQQIQELPRVHGLRVRRGSARVLRVVLVADVQDELTVGAGALQAGLTEHSADLGDELELLVGSREESVDEPRPLRAVEGQLRPLVRDEGRHEQPGHDLGAGGGLQLLPQMRHIDVPIDHTSGDAARIYPPLPPGHVSGGHCTEDGGRQDERVVRRPEAHEPGRDGVEADDGVR